MKRNCWDLFLILASLASALVIAVGAFLLVGPFAK